MIRMDLPHGRGLREGEARTTADPHQRDREPREGVADEHRGDVRRVHERREAPRLLVAAQAGGPATSARLLQGAPVTGPRPGVAGYAEVHPPDDALLQPAPQKARRSRESEVPLWAPLDVPLDDHAPEGSESCCQRAAAAKDLDEDLAAVAACTVAGAGQGALQGLGRRARASAGARRARTCTAAGTERNCWPTRPSFW